MVTKAFDASQSLRVYSPRARYARRRAEPFAKDD